MEESQLNAGARGTAGENHYVLVVHGTWNPAVEGSKTWHELDAGDPNNFCRRLNESLARRGMGSPVWAHPGKKEFHFPWTGANTHEARIKAADDLVAVVLEIERLDPAARIHFVAHSHGCNVVAAAVQRYLEQLRKTAQEVADSAINALDGVTPEQAWETGLVKHYGDRADAMRKHTHPLGAILQGMMRKELESYARQTFAKFAATRGEHAGSKLPWLNVNRFLASRWTKQRLQGGIAEFINLWETSKHTNRLESLVLLGAPFYHKVWIKRSWYSFGSIAGTLVDATIACALGFALAYLVFLYLWGVSYGAVAAYGTLFGNEYRLGWMGWNPVSWPNWTLWAGGLFVAVYTSAAWAVAGGWGLKDVNPYFGREELKTPGSAGGQSALPYRTLIVHAGLLDEILLAFSAEPIVYGVFGPHVRDLVKPELAFRIDALAAGQSFTYRNLVVRFIAASTRLIKGIALWCLGPVRRAWERKLTKTLLKIVSAPSFGLPAREFEDAIIVPDHSLRRPDIFAEKIEDVGRILISQPPFNVKSASAEARAQRYSAVWDKAERELQAGKSWLWRQVKPAFEQIASRHRDAHGGDISGLEERLLTTSLVLEERLREFAGVIELVHSSYYTNAEIIEKISTFIAGKDPGPTI